MSTSSVEGRKFSGNFEFFVKAKGIRGAEIKNISVHRREYEVLFQSDARFKVTDRVKSGDTWKIYMEEVS